MKRRVRSESGEWGVWSVECGEMRRSAYDVGGVEGVDEGGGAFVVRMRREGDVVHT